MGEAKGTASPLTLPQGREPGKEPGALQRGWVVSTNTREPALTACPHHAPCPTLPISLLADESTCFADKLSHAQCTVLPRV